MRKEADKAESSEMRSPRLEAEVHIRSKFENKRVPGENTNSLSNILNQQMSQLFYAGHHFIYELLQNADDAQASEVLFQIRGPHLIVTHNGEHFNRVDVDRICDISSSNVNQGKTKLEQPDKIGYKGIGFKAVFAISDEVIVLSEKYSFKFDKKEIQNFHSAENEDETQYPWQIMPIWISREEIQKEFSNIDPKKVIFILKNVDSAKVKSELNEIIFHPEILIFLRTVRALSFSENGQTDKIQKLECKEDIVQVQQLRHNKKTQIWDWLCFSQEIEVLPEVQEAIQKLPDSACPPKIKIAQKTKLTLAVEIKKEIEYFSFVSTRKTALYCYLPTQVNAGLSYLLNADFLLNQDRSDIIDNVWDQFLFRQIPQFQFQCLQRLAQDPRFKNNVLYLFARHYGHISDLPKALTKAYEEAYAEALKATAFIPSKDDGEVLKIDEAIIDETRFFYTFDASELDSSLLHSNPAKSRLIHPNLQNIEVLEKFKEIRVYTWKELQDKIENYIKILFSIEKYLIQSEILDFIVNFSRENIAIFRNKKILMTQDGRLASSCNSFVSIPEGSRQIVFPQEKELPLNIIAVDKYSKLVIQKWPISSLNVESYIRIYLVQLLFEKRITQKNWVRYLRFIYEACVQHGNLLEKIEKNLLESFNLSQFPVETRKGEMKLLCHCFMQVPEITFEIDPALLISQQLFQKEDNTDYWQRIFIAAGIQTKFELKVYTALYDKSERYFAAIDSELPKQFSCYFSEMIKKAQEISYYMNAPGKIRDLKDTAWLKDMLFFDLLFQKNVPIETRLHLFFTAIQNDPKSFTLCVKLDNTKPHINTALSEQFLIYFFKHHLQIRVKGRDHLEYPKDIFCTPKLLELSTQFKLPIPIPELPPIDLTLNQMKILGFKTDLLVSDIFEILKMTNQHHRQKSGTEEHICHLDSVYRLSLEFRDKPTAPYEFDLLAFDGKLYPAKTLQVYDLEDSEADSSTHLWLHPAYLDIKELKDLARFLGLHCFSEVEDSIQKPEIAPEYLGDAEKLRQFLLKALVIGVISEAQNNAPNDENRYLSLYTETLKKFERIKIIPSQPVRRTNFSAEQSKFSEKRTYAILKDDCLYFCGRLTEQTLLRKIVNLISSILFKAPFARSKFEKYLLLGLKADILKSEYYQKESLEFKRKVEYINSTYEEKGVEQKGEGESEQGKEPEKKRDSEKGKEPGRRSDSEEEKGFERKRDSEKGKEPERRRDSEKGKEPERMSDSEKEKESERGSDSEEERGAKRRRKSIKGKESEKESSNKQYPENPEILEYSILPTSDGSRKTPETSQKSSSKHANKKNLSAHEKKEIGYNGEQIIFFALKKKYQKKYEVKDTAKGFEILKEGQPCKNLEWHNKDKESNLPYDMTVERCNSAKQKPIKHIEVKATSKPGPSKVYYSINELREAFGENRYTLFKVNGVDPKKGITEKTKVYKIKAPAQSIFNPLNLSKLLEAPVPVVQVVFKI